MIFKVENFRPLFSQLERKKGPISVIYFDNGASTLNLNKVADRVNHYNRFEVSNVHRGNHQISRQSTENYEQARCKLQHFIHARRSEEVIFTSGTTESINLVANSLESKFKEGDEILISSMEHHSNIVPWQVLCEKKSCHLKVIPFDSKTGMTREIFKKNLSKKTKLVSLILYSNSFGNRLPVENIISDCRNHEIFTLIDAAQAPLSQTIDVQKLDCDFLTLSGHKMYGPYGIGILFGRKELLDSMPPYQVGGGMIDRVSFKKTTYGETPQKFEAGTPNIPGAIGLGMAADFIRNQNIDEQHQHVLNMRDSLKKELMKIDSVELYEFESKDYTGTISFNIKGTHPSDVGVLLDKYGVAVRSGHHCNQPLMDLMKLPGTVRVSLAPYNSLKEIDSFLRIIKKVKEFFQ